MTIYKRVPGGRNLGAWDSEVCPARRGHTWPASITPLAQGHAFVDVTFQNPAIANCSSQTELRLLSGHVGLKMCILLVNNNSINAY